MGKTEVYSWRVSAELKAKLEEAAREERTSVARLLEKIAHEWLARPLNGGDDEERQKRLHEKAAGFIGSIRGGDPTRAQEASQRVREKLRKKRGS